MTRFFKRNAGYKVFSLAAAFGLWLLLSGSRELTMSINAPVQYRNIPRALEISEGMVEEAHVIVRGRPALLSQVSREDLPLVIDLAEVKTPGERTITLSDRHLELPTGLVLERVIPSQVRIKLETRISREVPVRVRYEFVPEGMVVTTQEVVPERVMIIGPRSAVERVNFVESDPVDMRTLDANGEALVHVFTGQPMVQLVKAQPVRTRFSLEPRTGK